MFLQYSDMQVIEFANNLAKKRKPELKYYRSLYPFQIQDSNVKFSMEGSLF